MLAALVRRRSASLLPVTVTLLLLLPGTGSVCPAGSATLAVFWMLPVPFTVVFRVMSGRSV